MHSDENNITFIPQDLSWGLRRGSSDDALIDDALKDDTIAIASVDDTTTIANVDDASTIRPCSCHTAIHNAIIASVDGTATS